MRLVVAAACCLASCFAVVWPTPKAQTIAGPVGQVRDANPPKFNKEGPDVKIAGKDSYSFLPLESSKNKGKENSADIAATKNINSSIENSFSTILEKIDFRRLDLSKVQTSSMDLSSMGTQGGSSNRRSPSRNSEEPPDEPKWDRNSPYQSAGDRRGPSVNNRAQYQNPATSQKGSAFGVGYQNSGTAEVQQKSFQGKAGSASTKVQPHLPGSGKATSIPVGVVAIGNPGAAQKKAGSFSPTNPPLKYSNQGKKEQNAKMSG